MLQQYTVSWITSINNVEKCSGNPRLVLHAIHDEHLAAAASRASGRPSRRGQRTAVAASAFEQQSAEQCQRRGAQQQRNERRVTSGKCGRMVAPLAVVGHRARNGQRGGQRNGAIGAGADDGGRVGRGHALVAGVARLATSARPARKRPAAPVAWRSAGRAQGRARRLPSPPLPQTHTPAALMFPANDWFDVPAASRGPRSSCCRCFIRSRRLRYNRSR